MVSSLKGTALKIESSSSTRASSEGVSIPKLWNWKAINNSGIKALLLYYATIWIILAYRTSAFATSIDLNYGFNINANMLWTSFEL